MNEREVDIEGCRNCHSFEMSSDDINCIELTEPVESLAELVEGSRA